jgi:hypothetical protein
MLVFRIKAGRRGFEATPSSLVQPEVDAADPGVDADIDCHR